MLEPSAYAKSRHSIRTRSRRELWSWMVDPPLASVRMSPVYSMTPPTFESRVTTAGGLTYSTRAALAAVATRFAAAAFAITARTHFRQSLKVVEESLSLGSYLKDLVVRLILKIYLGETYGE